MAAHLYMPASRRLQFGDVIFDPGTRQLWRGGIEVHLSPKAFDLLALLIERRPDAVSKAEIRQRLWPDTFVSEANLPPLVTEIRDAVGDDARQPRVVRTLHAFGYAFVETARGVEPPAPEAASPMAWLVTEDRRIPLVAGENVLGREGQDVTALGSSTVSRRHARIVLTEGESVVEDLSSKNGTFVNDARVTAAVRLADGDRVRIGSLLFTFREGRAVSSTQTTSSSAHS